ncbi:hypothetical protein DL96DRAFT_913816 [Flagelloscypha sp. PMI_526]|nr:hypothetical protein DL96DRAFT_913816 [Flagelloscypha sp. PMI_526]
MDAYSKLISFQNDIPTLCACCLVSKSFLLLARPHLYENIDLICGGDDDAQTRRSHLLARTLSATPQFGQFVHRLELGFVPLRGYTPLAMRLFLFTNVRSLLLDPTDRSGIRTMWWAFAHPTIREVILPTVTRLEIRDLINFPFLHLIQWAPRMTQLDVKNCLPLTMSDCIDVVQPPPVNSSLRSLTLHRLSPYTFRMGSSFSLFLDIVAVELVDLEFAGDSGTDESVARVITQVCSRNPAVRHHQSFHLKGSLSNKSGVAGSSLSALPTMSRSRRWWRAFIAPLLSGSIKFIQLYTKHAHQSTRR